MRLPPVGSSSMNWLDIRVPRRRPRAVLLILRLAPGLRLHRPRRREDRASFPSHPKRAESRERDEIGGSTKARLARDDAARTGGGHGNHWHPGVAFVAGLFRPRRALRKNPVSGQSPKHL